MNVVEQVTFGSNNGWKVMADAYNSAITTLNTRASAYLNTTYASSARCVGSVPNNPDSESTEYLVYAFSSSPSTKKEDSNYQADFDQMNLLNITNINSAYWLASRGYWYQNIYNVSTGCRYITINGALFTPNSSTITTSGNETMIQLSYSSSKYSWYQAQEQTLGLRPVFILKSDVKIKGEGTESSPYYLSI
ncbi:MAG: hypothetical protein HFJ33_03650 [Clostridia bacterium]|nr:hypothetical protein [Clostridia bacterium]